MSTPEPSAAPLTAVVSYAHSDPGWTGEQTHARRQQVLRLVSVLRECGIDADADVFHQREDWSRWGPRKVAEADFVLIVASAAWRDAWLGSGDEQKNKGLRAETDVVRSIQERGTTQFLNRCRVILLPGSTDADIPDGMNGLVRHRVDGFDRSDIEPLVRDLTDQPEHRLPPLGDVPVLPPAMSTELSTSARGGDDGDRVEQVREQLAALPEPGPGDGEHQPWFRKRQELEAQLEQARADIARDDSPPSAPARGTPAGAAGEVVWSPASGVDLGGWGDRAGSGQRFAYPYPLCLVGLVPLPQQPVSQRLLSAAEDEVVGLVRQLGLVPDSEGVPVSTGANTVTFERPLARHAYGSVVMGQFQGLSVSAAGVVTVWVSLPRDNIGAVLDQAQLASDLGPALAVGAGLLQRLGVSDDQQVALAAELAQTTQLTGGALTDLGGRSSATMPGAFGRTVRLEPEESVPLAALGQSAGAAPVATTVAQLLVRRWTSQAR